MPIRVTCHQCGTKLGVPDTAAGKKVRCSNCQAVCEVPAAITPAAPPKAEFQDDEPAVAPNDEPEPADYDEPSEPSPRKKKKKRDAASGGTIVDLLLLRRMVAPFVILILYWLATGLSIIFGVIAIIGSIVVF